MADWDGGYKQNPDAVHKEDRKEVDKSSRKRRRKAADVTLEYLKLMAGNDLALPDHAEFIRMQEQQKRQLRPHGALEEAAPTHIEQDQVDDGQD